MKSLCLKFLGDVVLTHGSVPPMMVDRVEEAKFQKLLRVEGTIPGWRCQGNSLLSHSHLRGTASTDPLSPYPVLETAHTLVRLVDDIRSTANRRRWISRRFLVSNAHLAPKQSIR